MLGLQVCTTLLDEIQYFEEVLQIILMKVFGDVPTRTTAM
jgi:hypothetical protein